MIDVASAPLKGPATAPARVVEFSDFMCPFCRSLAGALSQFVPQAGGRVAVYFMNYPLDNACNPKLPRATHPGACTVALGSICAHYQGKFDAYHDRVFSTELHNPQAADVVRLAGEAGLNAAALEGCLDDPKTKADLAAQIAEGNRLGITATPTLYINGKKLPRINDFVRGGGQGGPQEGLPAAHPVGCASPAQPARRPCRLTRPATAASLPIRVMKLDAWMRQAHPLPERLAPRRAVEPGPERGPRPGRDPRRARARAGRGRGRPPV